MAEQAWTTVPHGNPGKYYRLIVNNLRVGIAFSEIRATEIVDSVNARLDVPDPEAFMAAHDKLVEEAQKVADVRHKVEQALIDKCAVADIPTTVADLQAALAAVKEASGVKTDKPKWQSPTRECDTYWKKMKGYIHLMTHPADGFTDWKETPPKGCDTKSVPYRMGDRLNLSLMSQDPLWQNYHTVFWSEDPDACPPT